MSNKTTPRVKRAPATKRSADEKRQALEQGLRITLDGRQYEVRFGDVTPAISRELRAATGMGWAQMTGLLMSDPDVDLLQAFVWVARRLKGERLSIDDVEMSYEDVIDIVQRNDIEAVTADDAGGDDEGPEA